MTDLEITEQAIETFRTWVASAPPESIVFFGGAGVSTESGIPDFRSPDGLFAQKYPYPAEVMVSRTFFDERPADFYDFYCERMVFPNAEPNRAHRKLAELERNGIVRAVITQNIDGLHQAAGSKTVFELHGSVLRNFCMACGASYSIDDVLSLHAASDDGVPRCPSCGGVVKPDVVLYEEALDSSVLQSSIEAIAKAGMLVIAGTSLSVHPAASLIDYFTGSHLVIINRTPTPRDRQADLCIAANVGTVFDF